MRKLLTSLMMLLFAVNVFAQSENEKISYQAVVRDAQNQLVANKTVNVTVSIFNGDATTATYSEMQTTTTNLNGLISLLIGPDGNNADWNSIQWNHARIETTVSLAGTSLGTLEMPLSAVPYALYAKEVDPNALVLQQLYSVISADSALLQEHIDTTSAHIRELLNHLEQHSDHIDTILQNYQEIVNYLASLEQVIITGDVQNLQQLIVAIAMVESSVQSLRDSVKTNITNIATLAAKEQADSALLGSRLDAIENAGYITRDVDNLTNYTTTTELQNTYATKAKVKQDSIDLGARIDAKADTSSVYTKGQIDDKLATKANTADVYTKTQTDINIHDTADVVRGEVNDKLAAKANIVDVYTKTQTDINIHDTADALRGEVNDKLATKANTVDVYTKTQTDINIHDTADVLRGEVNDKLATKANIADVYTIGQIDTKLADTAKYATKTKVKQDSIDLGARIDAKADTSSVYTKGQIDDKLAAKANIVDVYTKTQTDLNIHDTADVVRGEVNDKLATKANTVDVYTKTQTGINIHDTADALRGEVNDKLATKANTVDVYTKTQTDINIHDTADVLRGEVNDKLATKANIADVYTIGQIDTKLADTAKYATKTKVKQDSTYLKGLIDTKANTVDVYTKIQTDINIHDTADVLRGEMDTKLAAKADTSSVYTRLQIDTKLSDTARYATKMALKDTAAVIRSLIPDAQVQSNWAQTTVSAVDYIKNKPSISDSISNYLTTNNYVTETVLANAIHDSIMNNAVNEFTEEIHDSIVATIVTQINDTITEALAHINSCEAVNACVITALADGTSAINHVIDSIAVNNLAGAEQNVQSDWNVTDAGSDAYILNKPIISDSISNYLTTHGYVTETNVAATIHDSIENNISSQIHDSIADALSDYTIRSCGDVNGCLIVALASDFTTQLFVRSIISGYLNTNNYVTAADIPTKTSDLTNDSHFVSNENCEDLDICNLMATVNGLVNTVSNMQNTITDMQSTIDSLKGVIDDLGSTAPRLKVEGSGTAFSCTNNTRSTVYTTTITNANISDYTLSWKVNGTDSSSVHGNTLSCTFPSAGIYTVVCNATRAGYATLTDSVVVTVTVGAEPAISSTSVLGYTLTLAGVTNVSTISWGGDEGAEDIHGQTTAHHSYCAGTYTLMATNEDGCYLKLNETINAPVVNTSAATSVTTTEATFNGTLTNSDYVYTEKGFYYKRATDASYTQVDGTLSDSILTVELTGLSAGTTYHFYAYAIAEGCNTRITGNTLTFTTQAPIVTTDSASDITASFAKLSGIVSNYNNVTISSSGFDYKVTGSTNYTRVVGTFSDDTITAELTDLIYSTKYTYRAFAIYDNKTVYGDTLTFTTKTPTVTTGAASDITASSANLGGSAFNHDVTIVSIGFEYKETDSTDYIQVVGTLTDDTLTAELTGLTSSTEYTYRAFMTYGNNTVYGDPLTFTTITPSITTGAATDVTTSSVKLGGSVFNHDNLTIASIGFEYKKTGGTDYTQVVGTLTDDTLTAELTGITSSTECTYRAFMTFEDKTIYGDTNTFTTLSIVACSGHSAINSNETSTGSAGNYTVTSVKDGENNTYAVVSIGNQCWMAENMRATAYTKANPSGTLTLSTISATSSDDRFYYYPDGDENNVATYGLLYNWYAATDNESSNDNPNVQGICPNGWHIPTESEFSTMLTAAGATNAAGKLTAGLWGGYGSGAEPCNTDYPQRNSSGFSALPAGFFVNGNHYHLGYYARFWSSSEDGNSLALAYILNNVTIPTSNYEEGQSVRCLRNDMALTAITGAFSAVTTLSATLSGSITNPDYMPITSKGIEYKVTGSPTYTTVAVTGFENSFSIDLSNLDFGTEYTYRAFVTYDGKTVYGDELTFTTQSPTVTTGWASAVMSMSATLNGSVNNPDNLQITSRGFEFRDLCSTTYMTEISTDTDNSFTAGLTKLLTPRQYFYRAFATFGSKTVYGNEVTFTTKAESTSGTACQVSSIRPNEIGSGDRIYTVRDGQGNRYSVVKIGNQCWMAENMRATAYSKAHPSGTLTLSPNWAENKERFYYYPDGLECNVATYGLLYNWYAATDNRSYENNNNQNVQGICPEGWHIPTESEFSTMLTAAGATNAAGKLTAGLWEEYGSGAEPGNYSYSERNSSGFSALPAGQFLSGYAFGMFDNIYFWTSNEHGFNAGSLELMNASSNADIAGNYYQRGGAVRCIRDE